MADQLRAFPGLHYFEDNAIDRALFFGRETEIKQLAERIIAEDLTVLFGKSGDGKTSLINAGLKPALREAGYLPVRARVFNVPAAKTPLAALYDVIAEEAGANGVTLPPNWQHETLWESFLALRPTPENGLKPIVLILDQFEELFTLMAGRPQAQENFIAQLADLVRGRLPETVREKYRAQLATLAPQSDEARQLEQLLYGSPPLALRILLSLREDYLAFLNNLGQRIPKVFASRYRLSSLTIEQARAAIANPPQQEVLSDKKFRIEDDAIAALLKFLTVQSSRSGVNEEIVGPPQLQVLCQQLEAQMRQRGRNSIGVADLGGETGMRQLLSRYYRGILEKFPRLRFGPGPRRLTGMFGILRRLQPVHSPRFAVRRLCEDRLITAGGNRNSRHEDEILREIGVASADLQQLVESRLLRREPRLQESFYELSHDSLVPSLQIAGGMRQAWVMSLKVAVIAAVIFIATNWGWPYVQSLYEINSLESEFEEVESRNLDAKYFHTRIEQARDIIIDPIKLTEIQNKFDNWRINDLQSTFLLTSPGLPRADSLLKVLEDEYPQQKDLLAALNDTLNERRLLLIERRYWSLVLPDIGATTIVPRDSLEFARTLLEFAYTAFKKDSRIVKLQLDLAQRRGDTATARQLTLETKVSQESARKELLGAIQIAGPKNMIVKGDFSGQALSFELVLEYSPLLANATVLLNGKEMSGERIGSDKGNKLQSSTRQKEMPIRADKFRYGMVIIPAGERRVSVQITVRNNEGVEATKEFTIKVDREPPEMKLRSVLYKDTEKDEWKPMQQNEWRGNLWLIEVQANEPLQEASMSIQPRYSNPELSQISSMGGDNVQGSLSNDGRLVSFSHTTSEKFKIADEVECTLVMQDLAGWQSSISLGKWKIVKAQAAQEIKPTGQPAAFPLRSTPDENLTEKEVQTIIKKYDFYCSEGLPWSNSKGKGIANDFITLPSGQTVLDRATGLLWQQSGSPNRMTFAEAQKYVEELNRQKFAGYTDWRLPTLEEAMSLMEPVEIRGLYIDAKFDAQRWIWTSDIYSVSAAWVAHFNSGYCSPHGIGTNLYSVRAVRVGQ